MMAFVDNFHIAGDRVFRGDSGLDAAEKAA